MIKQDELSNPSSCLNKAARDEPLFVLRATDKRAPMAIRHWVTMSVGQQPPAKLDEALNLADQMEKWRRQHCPEPQSEVLPQAETLRQTDDDPLKGRGWSE